MQSVPHFEDGWRNVVLGRHHGSAVSVVFLVVDDLRVPPKNLPLSALTRLNLTDLFPQIVSVLIR